jgi:hypothetical protein
VPSPGKLVNKRDDTEEIDHMHQHSNQKEYRSDAPKGFESAYSQLSKWGEVDPEDHFDNIKAMVSSNSNEGEYLEAGPKGYNVIPYDPVVRAQIASLKKKKHGVPKNSANLQLNKWGVIDEEDTVDHLKGIISGNSHEGDYVNAGPKGYNAYPYDPIST